MNYLIDTDICSAHLKGRGAVTAKLLGNLGRLFNSAITLGELYVWALRSTAPPARLEALECFRKEIVVLDVSAQIARTFGELRAALLDLGQPKPQLDLLIAATAVVHGLVVVTHNVRDFSGIPGVTLDDWLM